MKSLHYVFFCLLTIALYFLSQKIASSSASSTFYPGRRFVTEVQVVVSSPNHKAPSQKTQDIDDETEQARVQDGSMALKYETSTGSLGDIVYHIDYHGVTTHPTPKHPKP